MERDGRLHAIECKLTERPSAHDLRGLHRLREMYGELLTERPSAHDSRGLYRLREMYGELVAPRADVACTTQAPFDLSPGVTAQPGWRPFPLK